MNIYLQKIKNLDYEKLLNYTILLYAFSLPLSRAGTSIASILLIILWLLQGNFKEKFQEIKSNNLIIAISVFIMYSFIATIWSSDKLYALTYYLPKYYHFLLIPIILTSIKKEYIEKVFSAFLLAMLISEITSYGIFFELWSKKGVSPSDPSPFMSHINYSVYLAFTAFILIHRVIFTKEMLLRVSYAIFFILSTSNLFLNGGRTGQFSFLIALALIGFLNFKSKLKATFISIGSAIVIFAVAYNVSPVFKHRFDYFINDVNKMVEHKDFTNSFSIRVGLWMSGLEASKHNILLGSGIGDEMIHAKKTVEELKIPQIFGSKHTQNYVDFHNAFIQYLVQLGLIGLIIFLSIFYFLMTIKIKDKVYKNILYMFVVLFILQSNLGSTFNIQKSMILFVLFSSLFLAISKYEKRF